MLAVGLAVNLATARAGAAAEVDLLALSPRSTARTTAVAAPPPRAPLRPPGAGWVTMEVVLSLITNGVTLIPPVAAVSALAGTPQQCHSDCTELVAIPILGAWIAFGALAPPWFSAWSTWGLGQADGRQGSYFRTAGWSFLARVATGGLTLALWALISPATLVVTGFLVAACASVVSGTVVEVVVANLPEAAQSPRLTPRPDFTPPLFAWSF